MSSQTREQEYACENDGFVHHTVVPVRAPQQINGVAHQEQVHPTIATVMQVTSNVWIELPVASQAPVSLEHVDREKKTPGVNVKVLAPPPLSSY